MPGAMRKLGLYLGLVEDDEEHRDSYDAYEDYDDEQPVRRYRPDEAAPARTTALRRFTNDGTETQGALAVDPRLRAATASHEEDVTSYRITTLHPRTYNEARTIGEHFREGTPVIMNLTEMDDTDAKRLVDFAAGLIFGLRGSIERVTNKVFLLSPQNIEVTAEDKARIAEGGFFNQS
jgi:cell division inhibitor SepF